MDMDNGNADKNEVVSGEDQEGGVTEEKVEAKVLQPAKASRKKINYYWIMAALVLASILFGAFISVPEHIAPLTNSLNHTKTNVERLAAASTAASAALTLVPGDFATPIAEKLADMSFYFIWILAAVYLEKILVTIAGLLVFQIILPAGIIIQSAARHLSNISLRKFGYKLIALGLVLGFLAPVSVGTSNLIQNQYHLELEASVKAVEEGTATVRDNADETNEDSNLWDKIVSKVKGGAATLMDKLEAMLNNIIDAIAIYLVTTCFIPVVTFLLGLWLIKSIFSIKGNVLPALPRGSAFQKKFAKQVKGEG